MWNVVEKQISIPFLLYSHLIPIIAGIAFGTFLYLKTKKLSAFYLLLYCFAFSSATFFDLVSWVPNSQWMLFSWSICDIFSIASFVFSYWFLYTFTKEHDLPLWQKVLTSSILVPTLAITGMSININTYLAPSDSASVNQIVTNYLSCVEVLFMVLIVIFTVVEYRKAISAASKNKVALAGAGAFASIFLLFFFYAIVNFIISINLWNLASTGYVYNVTPYAVFGILILLALLGYLIAKYEAFDVKLIKSVAYMVILMVLLFIGLFLV